MASANVELVRALLPEKVDMVQFIAAGISLPPETAVRLDPDFVVEFVPDVPGAMAASYEGLEGMAAGWNDWLAPYESYWIEVEEYIEVGDDVVLLAQVSARTHRDGVVVEHAPAAVCTIRDGTAVRLGFYLNRDQALAVVGKAR